MKNLLRLIPASILVLASCAALAERPDTIKVSAVSALVQKVADRHDAYVIADADLGEPARFGALGDSKHLRDTVGSFPADAKIPVHLIAADVRAVALRHDAYVMRDTSLDQLSQGVYLRSTELLVKLVVQAESGKSP